MSAGNNRNLSASSSFSSLTAFSASPTQERQQQEQTTQERQEKQLQNPSGAVASTRRRLMSPVDPTQSRPLLSHGARSAPLASRLSPREKNASCAPSKPFLITVLVAAAFAVAAPFALSQLGNSFEPRVQTNPIPLTKAQPVLPPPRPASEQQEGEPQSQQQQQQQQQELKPPVPAADPPAPSPPPAPPVRKASIIAACTNRHTQLRAALPSWIQADGVAEIVLVDWSSSPPLASVVEDVRRKISDASLGADLPAVKVVRVEKEEAWVLSRAYNLATRHATGSSLLKLDCDYVVSKSILADHPLASSSGEAGNSTATLFYTGFYLNSRDANEMHLNGALVVPTDLLRTVGGYDERIQRYGYDDEDLYTRLKQAGGQRRNVSYDDVRHLQHDDTARAQLGVRFPRAQIDVNVLLLERVNRTWSNSDRASEYRSLANDTITESGADVVLEASFIPKSLEQLVPKKQYDEVRMLALGRRLNNDFHIPWAVVSGFDVPMAERLLGNMMDRKKRAGIDEVREQGRSPGVVLVHPQNGLGNRIRTLGSALAYARATNREPIVIWERDVHLNASYSDVFDEDNSNFSIVRRFEPEWPIAPRAEFDATWGRFLFYNYMLNDKKDKPIIEDAEKNIYFKAASIMETNKTTWESTNEEILKLKVRDDILELVRSVHIENQTLVQLGGVHIRNRSLDDDIPGVQNNRNMYEKEDAVLLDKWRASSKLSNFVPTMRNMLTNGTVDKFFVASDTVAVCKELTEIFGRDKIAYLERDCDGRGAKCVKYALADLLLLAKSKVLLGSTWSSYTEAAMRLGGPKALMAGTDFGRGPTGEA